MCGILGYYGPKNAAQVVIDGLKKLEYRGYDSAGIAIPNGLGFFVHKNAGRVADVFSNFSLNGFSGGIAIGHTRWATHGGVTAANAHPHLSNNGKIAVAHNGIIENYQELRDQLIGEGFVFKSQTDTEVIPILIEKFMRQGKNFVDATKETLKTVEGSWAIAAYHIDEKKVIDLDDKEMVVVGEGGYQLFSLAKNIPVGRAPYLIDWDAEQAKKGNFDHFMIKEIMEQAEVIKRAIAQDKNIVMKIADEIKNAKDVYLIACGTAFHGCISASYVFAKIAKKSVRPIYAHEFPQFAEFLGPESLVIAVSQSGETADTLNAIRIAKERGAKVFSITNGMGSSLGRESTGALIQKAGPEICVVSTKAYTSQQAIQAMLAYSMIGKYDECISALKNLVMMIFYLTSENARVYTKNLAEKLRYAQHIYLLGRGMLYPAALEAALKIKEVS